jgi:hypothetical protein
MKNLKMYLILASLTSLTLISSCSTNTTKTDDQEVKAIDSVSDTLKKSDRELDAQAKKVEASLEKIDKENIAK